MPRAHGNVLFDYQDGFRLPLDKDADFKHDEEGVSSELVQVSLGMSQRGRSRVGMWQVRVMRTMSSLPLGNTQRLHDLHTCNASHTPGFAQASSISYLVF